MKTKRERIDELFENADLDGGITNGELFKMRLFEILDDKDNDEDFLAGLRQRTGTRMIMVRDIDGDERTLSLTAQEKQRLDQIAKARAMTRSQLLFPRK